VVLELPQQPWSAGHAAALNQRDRLAQFWLAAPEDLLPSFWASPLGEATKALVRQLTPASAFTPEQVNLRNAIGARLQAGFQAPCAIQLLIANWLYSPPGLLTIHNAQNQLPAWLLPAYQELYGPGAGSVAAPVLPTPAAPATTAPPQPATQLPQPDFGTFPATLQELINNRIQLNRMLGLANLYYIDPEDQEICGELRQLRLDLSAAIQRCPEQQLEQLWATDLGDRFWAMVRSGVQKEAPTPEEEALKQAATQRLQPSLGGGFGTPGALNALLVAMLFYEPGSMRVEGAEQKLPSWLLTPYQQVFAEAIAQAG
jgi:hypothetical protein